MSKIITQREARLLRDRVRALEDWISYDRRGLYMSTDASIILSIADVPEITSAIKTANALDRTVVAVATGKDGITFYAVPRSKAP
jgi:hypothetical protein